MIDVTVKSDIKAMEVWFDCKYCGESVSSEVQQMKAFAGSVTFFTVCPACGRINELNLCRL